MKIFITGASGFIGSQLAMALAGENHQVRALLRDPAKGADLRAKGISVVTGDLSGMEKLKAGISGCEWVFHLAAYTKPVSKDPGLPYLTNVTGTINMLEACRDQNVKRLIITSSAGTLGCSADGRPVTEETNNQQLYSTEYERTKAASEMEALKYNSETMSVIVVNPSRVYGPGKLTMSNSVTRIIKLYGKGIWRIMPGSGDATGNYVYINDVVSGITLAALNGKGGERYILGGENLTYREFFDILGEVYGRKRKLVTVRETFLKRLAGMSGFISALAGSQPFISDEWIDKYLRNYILSSQKAQSELNYKITPFREGAEKTVRWLRSNI